MDQEKIYRLLAKYFAGKSNSEEKLYIDNWRKENSENENIFKETSKIWDNSGIIDEEYKPDIAEALKKVNKKIEQVRNIPVIPQKTKRLEYFVIRIAAIVIISLSVWFAYVIFFEKEELISKTNSESRIETVILPDGSTVTLNQNSILKYPEKFNKKTRNVELVGEAYFEVAKNAEKPFIIFAQNSITKVLGTSFNLRAHSNEDNVILTVSEGKVQFASSSISNSRAVVLKAGDKGILQKSINVIREEKNEDLNFMAWRTGRLIFQNAPIERVADDLSRFYDTAFIVGSLGPDTVKITIEFNHSTIEDVIIAFNFIGIQFAKTDSGFVINNN